MKRILTFIAILAWMTGLACGATLSLVQPNGGEALVLGADYQIRWHAVGTGQKVKLVLIKSSGTIIGVIAEGLEASTQAYPWKVGKYQGGTAAPANDYKIRIKNLDGSLVDASDAGFTIKAADAGSDFTLVSQMAKIEKKPVDLDKISFKITVNAPEANGQYEAGQPLHVAWNKNFGFNADVHMAFCDDQGAEQEHVGPIPNTGTFDGWIPTAKYTWPGRKYKIRLTATNLTNQAQVYGYSGLFSITSPPTVQKVTRTLARNGETDTTHTRQYQDEGTAECLSASHPAPGRAPAGREIKVGHHVASGRHGQCDWYEAYYFQGSVSFDLDEIQGKEIVEAKLLVSLNEFQEKGPQGTLATNEECDSSCDIHVRDSGFPGGLLTSFSIIGVAEKKSIDVTQAVKHWAAGNPNNGLLFRARLEHSKFSESICLKYYGTMFLTVKYIEYK